MSDDTLAASPEEPTDARLRALEQERDGALRALGDLDHDHAVGALDEGSYQALRDEGTARAAAAIRALEAARADAEAPGGREPPAEGDQAPPAAPDAVPAASQGGGEGGGPTRGDGGRRSPGTRRRWLLVGSIAAFVVAAGILVGRYAATRLPGQEVSGTITHTSSPRLDAKHLAERLVEGRVLASQGKDVAAAKVFSQALKTDPNQPEALAYEGWLLRQSGKADHNAKLVGQGRALVGEAIAADPGYADAHVFLGYMLLQDSHDPVDAVDQFNLFLGDHPAKALVARTAPVMAQAYREVHQPVPPAVAAALHTTGTTG
ncbi:MAG TPA: hypothetical protein VE152_05400 [Acidimicrobiales bacterium]|nr:hypothetical protein [Acidimicrobiales bacterium]